MRIIGIMGPGEGATPEIWDQAYQLGFLVAEAGWVVLTGGRNAGVMAAASQGAKAAGGLTIGILPDHDRRNCSPAVDLAIITGLGHARNAINILSSEVVVVCGMGSGTASEAALALKMGKPLILLACPKIGIDFFTRLGSVLAVETPEAAIVQIHQWLN